MQMIQNYAARIELWYLGTFIYLLDESPTFQQYFVKIVRGAHYTRSIIPERFEWTLMGIVFLIASVIGYQF